MSIAHVLLGLLARDGSQHGYGLKREYDSRLPRVRPLAFGQVYATLGRLVRDDLVVEVGRDREAGPDRTTYALTDKGHEELHTWLAQIETPAPHVTDALFVKVMVALLAQPDERAAREYLIAQRDAHTGRMRELTAVKSDPAASLGDTVAADYAIGHLDADLGWIRTTLARLARLRVDLVETNGGTDD